MEIHEKNNYLRIIYLLFCLLLTENVFAQYAIKLDNDSAYISYGEASAFNVENITIETWIKLNDYRPGVIIAKPGAYYLRVNDALQLDAGIYDDSDEDWFIITGKTQLDINEFYHVAFTYDGKTLSIYLNGKSEGTNNHSGKISPFLTNGIYAGNHFFIDDFSDYTDPDKDERIYKHENYGGAYQEIDVINERYYFTGTNGPFDVADEAISSIKTLTTSDHIVSIDVLWEQQEGNAYIAQRFSDVRDKYEVAIDPEHDVIYFNKVINNHWEYLCFDKVPLVENNIWYNLKSQIITIDSIYSIKAWFNDSLYLNCNDSDLDDNKLGIITHDHDSVSFTYIIYFDNWIVNIPFNGIIDEIRIFDTALPQNTIIDWMCQLIDSSHPYRWNLHGYWRFDDQSNPTQDYSINLNNGDVFNAYFVNSKVPEGYDCTSITGNHNLKETAAVPVSIRWDKNMPGSNAIVNVLQINDYPNRIDGLQKNYPPVYWDIHNDDDNGFIADVDFYYNNLALITDESALTLFTRNHIGDSWTLVPDITINNQGDDTDGIGYITANDLASFGQFIISSNSADNSFPTEITIFTAKIEGDEIFLNWRTESELDNKKYEIERSLPAEQSVDFNWENIGFISGYTNHNSYIDYSFCDKDIRNSGKYFYRLKQIDINGSYSYSPSLKVNFVKPSRYHLAQNYPNPSNPYTSIQYSIPEDSYLKLTVYNILGQIVAELFNGISEIGNYSIKFNGSHLENGIYYYRIEARSLDNKKSFTSIKKMALIK